ncbi:MAG: zinc ribbon domain-containing protein [Gemmatimonadetes bacterium]|nr:zinc ribbon domain-containing protein [Gemmatimonadota bacterium]
MASCPHCRAPLPRPVADCPRCGSSALAHVDVCPRCRENIAAGAESCPACGWLRASEPCPEHGREAPGRCVICDRPVCPECEGAEAPQYLCSEHGLVPVVEGWAQVYSTSDDLEAELIRDNLHAEGMDAQVLSQKDHYSFTVDLGDLSPVRVLVPAYQYQEANRLIRNHMDDQGQVSFACPRCGEAYEAGDEVCAACGAPLP